MPHRDKVLKALCVEAAEHCKNANRPIPGDVGDVPWPEVVAFDCPMERAMALATPGGLEAGGSEEVGMGAQRVDTPPHERRR